MYGIENTESYIPLLRGKKLGICANKHSMINNIHLVDFLISNKCNVIKIFSPEHGFEMNTDPGVHIKNTSYFNNKIPIISLYNENKKPKKKDLKNIDLLIFDIQDVGTRYYTYISTLHYIMEACAENNISLIVLDRPNPNSHYIDGPVLETEFSSFVGMHPVPIVYGMTIGEYALMINGEQWIKKKCDLKIIPCKNYAHDSIYYLTHPPSPNLTNNLSINLYPSLCLFEGTNISVGRGTDYPFQIFGSPFLKNTNFYFIPQTSFGAEKPVYKGIKCYGFDLRNTNRLSEINLNWLIFSYNNTKEQTSFFNPLFNKLAGNSSLQEDIKNNIPAKKIKEKWKKNIDEFKKTRNKYLLYP